MKFHESYKHNYYNLLEMYIYKIDSVVFIAERRGHYPGAKTDRQHNCLNKIDEQNFFRGFFENSCIINQPNLTQSGNRWRPL